jgi:hypothetical protein
VIIIYSIIHAHVKSYLSSPSASQSIPPVDPEVDPRGGLSTGRGQWTEPDGLVTYVISISLFLHKQLNILPPITPFPFLRSREP